MSPKWVKCVRHLQRPDNAGHSVTKDVSDSDHLQVNCAKARASSNIPKFTEEPLKKFIEKCSTVWISKLAQFQANISLIGSEAANWL